MNQLCKDVDDLANLPIRPKLRRRIVKLKKEDYDFSPLVGKSKEVWHAVWEYEFHREFWHTSEGDQLLPPFLCLSAERRQQEVNIRTTPPKLAEPAWEMLPNPFQERLFADEHYFQGLSTHLTHRFVIDWGKRKEAIRVALLDWLDEAYRTHRRKALTRGQRKDHRAWTTDLAIYRASQVWNLAQCQIKLSSWISSSRLTASHFRDAQVRTLKRLESHQQRLDKMPLDDLLPSSSAQNTLNSKEHKHAGHPHTVADEKSKR